MKSLFRRFDPRLASDLKLQRKSILAGLICVALTGLLTSATIPLIKLSMEAIEVAATGTAPTKVGRQLSSPEKPPPLDAEQVERLAQRLGVSAEAARSALKEAVAAPNERPKGAEQLRREAVERLGWLSLLVVAIFAVKYWFTRGQTYYLSKAGADLAADLRRRLFRKLQRLPIAYYNERRSGAIQSVLTNDVNVYQHALGMIRDSIDGPVKAVSALAMILYLQWQLALISAFFIPIIALYIQSNGRQMLRAQRKVQQDLSNLSAMTHEALLGAKVVKAFAAEATVEESFRSLVNDWLKSQLVAAKRIATLRPMVELIGAFALAVTLYICGRLAFAGQLFVSDIVAVVYAMDVINQGFRAMGSVNNTYKQVQAAAERIYHEVLEVEEEHATASGTKTLERVEGKVEFRHVSFTYPDGTRALSDVSFSIEPGTSLALVGPSGAGKSTIADLLLRFYDPSEGAILLDGTDIRELDTSWLRLLIGVVPQHTFLFAGTIADNIRLGNPQAGQDAIEAAARAASADGFIRNMPHRFLTELGERGVRLSGGEMQRVAIARALVRKPRILVLDEATSNLDPISEKAVQEALVSVMRGRTSLFIAHRLTTAARADRILVLSRGEVIEEGSHRELMERGGVYAGMYRAFSSGVMDEAF